MLIYTCHIHIKDPRSHVGRRTFLVVHRVNRRDGPHPPFVQDARQSCTRLVLPVVCGRLLRLRVHELVPRMGEARLGKWLGVGCADVAVLHRRIHHRNPQAAQTTHSRGMKPPK